MEENVSLGNAGGGGAGAGFEVFEAEGRLPLKLKKIKNVNIFVYKERIISIQRTPLVVVEAVASELLSQHSAVVVVVRAESLEPVQSIVFDLD